MKINANTNLLNCNALILAAGISSRMGFSKVLLKLPDGTLFLEFLIAQYQNCGVKDIAVVINPQACESLLKDRPYLVDHVRFIKNPFPERGRSYSLALVIKELDKNVPLFVQNIDNPFINDGLIHGMYSILETNSFVVPVHQEKKGHPVLLSGQIVGDFPVNPDKDLRMDHFLDNYKRVDFDTTFSEVLFNINTPAEYETFIQFIQG